MNEAFLSIGTNIGEREKNLQDAIRVLMAQDGVKIVAISSIYETAAVGYTEQADFLNIAVALETTLSPKALSPLNSEPGYALTLFMPPI